MADVDLLSVFPLIPGLANCQQNYQAQTKIYEDKLL